ncbi:hypothetical protein [Niveibacterium sp. SC-1]|uniref:hypothetical protein n=1 Tax=Niveibacterium sp. SC-1 TaxID=3135646 RepID=UPI00311F110E
MSANIKIFHSAMPGAPVLSGTAGALIAILDACLVNGFGLKSVDSIVVAAGIATVSIPSGHIFEKDSCITVAGATPAGLNGEKKVLSATATTLTFDATGIANGAATGTLTAVLTPAGFTKLFSGTNLAAYKSSNPAASGGVLRVDDTATQSARLTGYESMSDVNTGVGKTPTDVQVSGGLYWPKSSAASAAARDWMVIADDRTFYVFLAPSTTYSPTRYFTAGFGDTLPTLATDTTYSWFVSGQPAFDPSVTGSTTRASDLGYANFNLTSGARYSPRSFTGLGSAVRLDNPNIKWRSGPSWSGNTAASNIFIAFPNCDGGLYIERSQLLEATTTTGWYFRAELPGFYHLPQQTGDQFLTRDRLPTNNALVGRSVWAVRCGAAVTSGDFGTVALDITGPWR